MNGTPIRVRIRHPPTRTRFSRHGTTNADIPPLQNQTHPPSRI
jgi:hypothetical protein